MSTTNLLTTTIRDKQVLLAALAKDVLTSIGQDSVRISDEGQTFLVSRVIKPRRLDGKPSECTDERAQMIQHRLATPELSEPLFEMEVEID